MISKVGARGGTRHHLLEVPGKTEKINTRVLSQVNMLFWRHRVQIPVGDKLFWLRYFANFPSSKFALNVADRFSF
jgi:hypothetical protein